MFNIKLALNNLISCITSKFTCAVEKPDVIKAPSRKVDPHFEFAKIIVNNLNDMHGEHKDSCIAGGYARDVFLKVKPNDIDIITRIGEEKVADMLYELTHDTDYFIEEHFYGSTTYGDLDDINTKLVGVFKIMYKPKETTQCSALADCLGRVPAGIIDFVPVIDVVLTNIPVKERIATFPSNSAKAWYNHKDDTFGCTGDFLDFLNDKVLTVNVRQAKYAAKIVKKFREEDGYTHVGTFSVN